MEKMQPPRDMQSPGLSYCGTACTAELLKVNTFHNLLQQKVWAAAKKTMFQNKSAFLAIMPAFCVLDIKSTTWLINPLFAVTASIANRLT